MGEHLHDALAHQRAHADGVARVVGEHQESRHVRQEAAVQRDPVGDRRHSELAHAVEDRVPGRIARDRLRKRMDGQVRMRQIGRAAEHFRQFAGERRKRVLARLARRQRFALRCSCGDERVGHRGKLGWQFAARAAGEFGTEIGIGGAVALETLVSSANHFATLPSIEMPLSS